MKSSLEIANRTAMWFLGAIFVFILFLHKKVIPLDIQGVHAWRQCQTMWNVRNFVRHDSNILNPRVSYFNGGSENILRYEFPLLQYAIAMVFKVTGEHMVVVRLLLFVIAVLTSFGFFYLLRDIFDHNLTAVIGTFLLQFSPVFYFYSWNPLPDNLALCGAVWYLQLIVKYDKSRNLRDLISASFALLIATWAKLPYLMFSAVGIHFFFRYSLGQFRNRKLWLSFGGVQLLFLVPAFLWYAWVMPSWTGNSVLVGIFDNPLPWSEYRDIILYHAGHMIPRLLAYPAVWLFFILGIIHYWKSKPKIKWLLTLMFITFLYQALQLNAINKIHDYYMMPFLPWIFIIVSYGVHFTVTYEKKWLLILAVLAFVAAPIDTSIFVNPRWEQSRDGLNNDVYEHRKELEDAVPVDAMCIILNDRSQHVFSYNIDKMGHIFFYDELPIDWIADMIDNYGITHMYSDSRLIDQDPDFQKYVDSLLLTAGSVYVYKLRDPLSDTIKYLPDFKKKTISLR